MGIINNSTIGSSTGLGSAHPFLVSKDDQILPTSQASGHTAPPEPCYDFNFPMNIGTTLNDSMYNHALSSPSQIAYSPAGVSLSFETGVTPEHIEPCLTRKADSPITNSPGSRKAGIKKPGRKWKARMNLGQDELPRILNDSSIRSEKKRARRELACPFFKHGCRGLNGIFSQACVHPGFPDISRLK